LLALRQLEEIYVGAPDRIARWSLGAAALAGTCIVLYFILDHYQHYYLEQEPIVFNYWMIFIECILSWSRLSEQIFRLDKWSLCRVRLPSGMAAG